MLAPSSLSTPAPACVKLPVPLITPEWVALPTDRVALAYRPETRRELIESKKTLEDQTGRPVRWFAYPFGGRQNFRPERLPLVYEAGYEACFSGFGGFVYPRKAEPVVPREPVPCFRSLLNLELHLAGCLDWVYAVKRQVGMIT